MMLIWDMKANVGNNKVTNIVGTNGEVTLNKKAKKNRDFCKFSNSKTMNTLLSIYEFTWEVR